MKDVIGYEGKYAVTKAGKVWSYAKVNSNHKGKFLAENKVAGYVQVSLYLQGKSKRLLVHRIVAQTYIPNPLLKPEVNHKDGNKINNDINNLEWVTKKENAQHALARGKYKSTRGSLNGASKLSDEKIKKIRATWGKGCQSQAQLGKKFQVTQPLISLIVRGKIWGHIH